MRRYRSLCEKELDLLAAPVATLWHSLNSRLEAAAGLAANPFPGTAAGIVGAGTRLAPS